MPERLFKMTGITKRKALILLGLAILITMIIAGNITHFQPQPGMPLPRFQHGQLVAQPIADSQYISISALRFILIFIAIILTAAALYAIVQLLRGMDWKSISDFLRSMFIVSAIIAGLVFIITLFSTSDTHTPVEIPPPTPQPVVTSPLGSAPPMLLWLVGIGLIVVSALVVMWLFKSHPQARTIDLVALEAEKAQQALRTGAGLKDVIINCYIQMSVAVKQEQNIERENFMTTGEFETLLKAEGIPDEPIHQLTRLFDAVRYGNWQSNPLDEQKAMQCLEDIMVYSRATRGMN
jgi:hypothetical protein